MLVRLERKVIPQVEERVVLYTQSQRLPSTQMSFLQILQFHKVHRHSPPSIPAPAFCMLKDRSSIYKTVRLDKHQLILWAGKDTGKVLKMAIRIKKLEVVGQVIFKAPIPALRLTRLLSGREKHTVEKFMKNELHMLMAQFIYNSCPCRFNSRFARGIMQIYGYGTNSPTKSVQNAASMTQLWVGTKHTNIYFTLN